MYGLKKNLTPGNKSERKNGSRATKIRRLPSPHSVPIVAPSLFHLAPNEPCKIFSLILVFFSSQFLFLFFRTFIPFSSPLYHHSFFQRRKFFACFSNEQTRQLSRHVYSRTGWYCALLFLFKRYSNQWFLNDTFLRSFKFFFFFDGPPRTLETIRETTKFHCNFCFASSFCCRKWKSFDGFCRGTFGKDERIW